MKVIIMQGASGSGKSTYVSKIEGRTNVCSADHFFMVDGEYKFDPTKLGEAHASCMRDFLFALETAVQYQNAALDCGDDDYGIDAVIVDNTNTTQVEMAPYVAVAAAYGFPVEIVRCVAPAAVCAKRNTHGVPVGACEAMIKRMQDPAPFWDVTITKLATASYGWRE